MVPVGRIKARDTVARYIFSDQPQTNRQIEPAGKETTWQLRIKRLREEQGSHKMAEPLVHIIDDDEVVRSAVPSRIRLD
jgi:hypothetical protein